jgi:hypothetical protein
VDEGLGLRVDSVAFCWTSRKGVGVWNIEFWIRVLRVD